MEFVTVSPKYQVVIPKEVREDLKIKPGSKIGFLEIDGHYTLLTPLDPKLGRGSLTDIDSNFDKDRSEDRY